MTSIEGLFNTYAASLVIAALSNHSLYIPLHKRFPTFTVSSTIKLCAWRGGREHGRAVHVWRPAALKSQTDAPYGSAGFGGHLLKTALFSCADFSTWGKFWFPWLMFAPSLGKHWWKFKAALSEVGFSNKWDPCSPWFSSSAVAYFSIQWA